MPEFGKFEDIETLGEIQIRHGEISAMLGWDKESNDSFVIVNSGSVLGGRLSMLTVKDLGDFITQVHRLAYIFLNKLGNT